MPRKIKVTRRQLEELVDDDGTLISSAVPDNAYLQSTIQNTTTDDHVKQARQQMIWMQYRRYYGESASKPTDKLTLMADKYANDPEKFYNYLQRIGEEHKFSKFFVKKNQQPEELKENFKQGDAITKIEEILAEYGKQ